MMDDAERRRRGLGTRREILGEAYVDRAQSGVTPFTADFQDLITRYAWGEIWTRPGLDPLTRRLLTISMLVALGREQELRLHIEAALDGGVSPDTLKEVLLQSAIYCGVPAANAAFHAAADILARRAREGVP